MNTAGSWERRYLSDLSWLSRDMVPGIYHHPGTAVNPHGERVAERVFLTGQHGPR